MFWTLNKKNEAGIYGTIPALIETEKLDEKKYKQKLKYAFSTKKLTSFEDGNIRVERLNMIGSKHWKFDTRI